MKRYERADIDEGIVDLIDLMNDIPFVETYGCCEGHIVELWPAERKRLAQYRASHGQPSYDPSERLFDTKFGYVDFFVSGRVNKKDANFPYVERFDHPLSVEFLARAEEVAGRHPRSDLRLLEIFPGIRWSQSPCYDFVVNPRSIGQPLDASEKAKEAIDEAMEDMYSMCESFIAQFEPTGWKVDKEDPRLRSAGIGRKLKERVWPEEEEQE